jgi:tRNA nucleotidyltransferase (CCA-adding enzyme)
MEAQPVRMFEVLRGCGALARLMPELAVPDALAPTWQALRMAAQRQLDLPARFAILMHQMVALVDVEACCQRLRVPAECRDLAILLRRELPNLIEPMPPEPMVALLQRCDAWRKPARFELLLQAANCITCITDSTSVPGIPAIPALPSITDAASQRLRCALQAAQQVQGGEIAKQFPAQPQRIAQAIHAARVAAVAAVAAGLQQSESR